ncbi:Major royal jelly protein OS=[Oscillatoria] sp. PCC 6506 GN=OSCI_3800088 PE=4 SV=1: MRJP [Gemmata massiliana]|uniref:Gluconolaconase n=1 Tax=Gemmata massiliana TaxID=1210884 RepID=A0A6P2CTB3_9BACT|nr:L-dopachrome tautomerase-related protein [Gemmata massiliana]VTR91626.1 Major royal jelly protein OS=[Oscillatoria] sp. PCC 6506 GN=OSCI_3800088 PE=4 SV=1: MRJP [Gemmata massiliana]
MKRLLPVLLLAVSAAAPADEPKLAADKPEGKLELVATFDGPMPTGVTVSHKGRVFVNYPRWGDPVEFTTAEVRDGKATAFPPDINKYDKSRPGETLVSVQSVVVDPADRLWLLDTGSIEFGPPSGPKLVGVDLATDKVFKVIAFPPDVALPTTYLNDIRFDLRKGKAGVAFITDSAQKGPNGIIVVDLDSGKSRRRLNDHPSTKAAKNFLPIVEGRPVMERKPGEPPKHLALGSDGIAISHDGKHLYYCPLASRHLFRVPTDALLGEKLADEEAGQAVEDLGDRGFASDGLETDDKGRVYLTDYEHNAVLRRTTDGRYETVAHDPRMLWPDTMSVAADGHLYFTANQLHRQKNYQNGKDLREKPYALFRVKIDAGPVLLTGAK